MTLRRFAKRKDASQTLIVSAIRASGWLVVVLDRPVDLLCWKASKGFRCIECKPLVGKRDPKARIRTDQKEQNDFCDLTGTPRCATPEEALLFLNS